MSDLVSCTVISYNSAKTVIETLESIKAQTYKEIELIVSDDCSTDNTVDICREWLNHNKERFIRTELLTIDHNTGISANENRAVAACRGKWQKGIAADDILLPNCVEDFVNYVHDHPEARWVSSRIRKYRGTFEEKNCIARNYSFDPSLFDLSPEDQLKSLFFSNVLIAPSMFYELSLKKEIKIDTKYMFEDLPFYVAALEKGVKCYFLDKETVSYRICQSVSQSNTKLFNYKSLLDFRKFREERMFKHMTAEQIECQKKIWEVQDFFERRGLNKKKKLNSFLYRHICTIIRKLYKCK